MKKSKKSKAVVVNRVVYEDSRGWKFRVLRDAATCLFRTMYHRPEYPDNICWKCYGRLPWRDSFDEAQDDLDEYAAMKDWNYEVL